MTTMLLTATAAKSLALVVLYSTVGHAEGKALLPLRVASGDGTWIVHGRTLPFPKWTSLRLTFYAYIDKSSAEILDFGTAAGNFPLPPSTMRILRQSGWHPPRRRDLVLGLPRKPNPNGVPPDLVMVVYHGVLGTSEAAIAYARVLVRSAPDLARATHGDLTADLRDKVWHITWHAPDGREQHEVLRLSQITGKMLPSTGPGQPASKPPPSR